MVKISDKQLDLPRMRGIERMEKAPRAYSVGFDKKSKSIKLVLVNGVTLTIPVALIEILAKASEDEIRTTELLLDGLYVRWPKLDENLNIENLIEGTFGTAKWMSGLKTHLAELGRKGGRSRSATKTLASRLNGAKGGRPRKSIVA
jgi:hypothetical protein